MDAPPFKPGDDVFVWVHRRWRPGKVVSVGRKWAYVNYVRNINGGRSVCMRLFEDVHISMPEDASSLVERERPFSTLYEAACEVERWADIMRQLGTRASHAQREGYRQAVSKFDAMCRGYGAGITATPERAAMIAAAVRRVVEERTSEASTEVSQAQS